MSTDEAKLRETIRELCAQALEGKLTLEDLHAKWPVLGEPDPFYEQVFDDLQDGVEHFPAKFWSGEVDHDGWRASSRYLRLYLDSLLLRRAGNRSNQELRRCREKVVQGQGFTSGRIEEHVSDCLSST